MSLDTETTGTARGSEIIGFSISAEIDVGYYVVLSYWDVLTNQLIALETKQYAKEFLQNLVGKSLIMHNGIFDCSMIDDNFQVSLIGSLHTDTLILGHLLNENRRNGLKELGESLYGADARKEQALMKESVHKNGGMLTKDKYELYKADPDLIGKYGAKDAILTLKLAYEFIPRLADEGLEDFFYKDESMPLLRGPTYQLNTTGLRVDAEALSTLKGTLEAGCLEAKAFIYKEIASHIKTKYKGTNKANTFNIGAPKQLSWLLYSQLGNDFQLLTESGRELCTALHIKIPYAPADRREFIRVVKENKDRVYEQGVYNPKTKKMGRPKKISDFWNYVACGKESLAKLAHKYKWVQKYLEYAKNLKLLNTYVEGIQERAQYNIIRPSFLQHGTTSGRYSSRNPNFQNLPRDDKRIKKCIVSRPGKIFVGADYAQLEPRVFASFSGDERLLKCFEDGDDFYSVIGREVFGKYDCSLKKDDPNSFAKKYPELRNIAKIVGLSATYGTTAAKMAPSIKKTIKEAREVIEDYFERFPKVRQLMLSSHEEAKKNGRVTNLFGRPRRMPEALEITKLYGNTPHEKLDYKIRNILNLAINHKIQSTGASIMNRAAIAFDNIAKARRAEDNRWFEVKIVLQVHDELVIEGPEMLGDSMAEALKVAMEDTIALPGVALIAEPKKAYNLADLK